MERIILIWPEEEYRKFEKFLDNLKIDKIIKDQILGQLDGLITETAILQIRERLKKEYYKKQMY